MVTIENALNLFLLDRELKGNTEKTIKNYKQQIQYFIDFIGNINTSDITLKSLTDYQFYLMNKDKYDNHPFKINEIGTIGKVTVQSYLRQLRVFIKYLYDEEYLKDDLTKKFKLPKAPKKVIEILTDDEIDILLNAYKENSEFQLRNKCIIALMLDSGLRRNEILTLEYNNIYLTQNYIKVLGKGQKERLVPLGLMTKKLLMKYFNLRSMPEYETNKLFMDRNLKPMSDNAIKMMFTRLRNKTGIERLHPHILRHTFATKYIINGGDIFSLQQILGHTSLDMVRRYSHLASSYVIANHKRLSPLDQIQKKKYNY
ncbi:tyrosine-type recombinase/integrase [Tissierella carlieri]|uniref:Tyrosine-type recombinase/integrase n=1 Tax=Tissierella carlieri TaxID=689904 RepID=A0ABT1S9E4_9FIRM|nr:tyrosine-type recombinase/integrase [Tissierella carlieri]MCQ4922972.1 tyrosine-type recombinase/integrase [Tissierella carlieri]